MKFSLIICTYKRHESIKLLIDSILIQTLYPNEILIIDGSPDNLTKQLIENNNYQNVIYYKVNEKDRGLTKQRNYGISKINNESEVVCFLDDDTILEKDYFKNIIEVYLNNPSIVGVGGIATNENKWKLKDPNTTYNKNKYYEFENYVIKESSRNVIRNILCLASDLPPGKMPSFSHGRTYGFPMTNKFYNVDLLIGMSMSFRKKIVDSIKFSTYFEGYGLYEDADYSLRALKFGQNVITTNAKLEHHHAPSGRPNQYKYGKMVVRNGWYVWRIKNPNPSLKDRFKWNAITILLAILRFFNIFTTNKPKEAFTEFMGRTVGWFSLIFNKPKVEL